MKWLAAVCILLVSSFVAGKNNPVPLVNDALSPTSVAPGGAAFTLTVYGAGFSSSALVNWNGSTRVTSVISPRELKASISASDVAKAGTAWITVTNPGPGGGTSNVVFFPITPGSPATAMAINLVAPNAGVAAVGDFNNDHKLDVLFGSTYWGALYLGDGKGGFLAPISAPPGFQILVGDINGDGKLDLVTVDQGGFVAAYLGSGTGTFSTSWSFQENGGGNTIAMADFNQDGHLDLYIMGYNLAQRWFHIYLGQGDGTFILGGGNQVGYFAGIPAVADFNGDGILDLAVPEIFGGSVDIFLGTGTGAFNEVGTVPAGFQRQVTAADFNHDGKMDLLTDGGCVLLGNGDGTFVPAGCGHLSGTGLAGVGDFNGDGLLDAVVQANQGSGFAEALQLGTGDGFFGGFSLFGIGTPPGAIFGAVGDFNNDGLLDIAAPDGYVLLQTTVSLTPLSLAFGNQNIGTKSPPQPATLTNVGTTALTIQQIKFMGSGAPSFLQTNNCGTTLAADASCTIAAVFKPVAAGPQSAFLSVSYVGTASPQTVAVSGVGLTPPTVSLQPSALTFATQLVGTSSSPQSVTLTNTGDQDVTLTSIKATGAFSQTNDCPATLTVGATCNIQVVFAPTNAGISTGSIVVTDNAKGSPQRIKLSGTGTVALFSPVAVNFGNQKVGTQSGPATITLTNVGTKTLNITQIALSGANPGDFKESNNCGSKVLGKGSCTITVTFKPSAKGARSASVSVSDDGGASPQTVPLSGTGT